MMLLNYLNSGLRRYGEKPAWGFRRNRCEVVWVREGACWPELEGLALAGVTEPSMLWAFPIGSDHCWRDEIDGHSFIHVVHLGEIPEVLDVFLRDRKFWATSVLDDTFPELEEIWRKFEQEIGDQGPLSRLRIQSAIYALVHLLLQDAPIQESKRLDSPEIMVSRAIEYFKDHLAEGPTVEIIAEDLRLSSVHLGRLFRRVCGKEPGRVFREIKMEQARERLMDRRSSVEETAEVLGYSESSAFSRAFKAYHGISPREFRSSGQSE